MERRHIKYGDNTLSERKYTREQAQSMANAAARTRNKAEQRDFWNGVVFASDIPTHGSLYWRINLGGQPEL